MDNIPVPDQGEQPPLAQFRQFHTATTCDIEFEQSGCDINQFLLSAEKSNSITLYCRGFVNNNTSEGVGDNRSTKNQHLSKSLNNSFLHQVTHVGDLSEVPVSISDSEQPLVCVDELPVDSDQVEESVEQLQSPTSFTSEPSPISLGNQATETTHQQTISLCSSASPTSCVVSYSGKDSHYIASESPDVSHTVSCLHEGREMENLSVSSQIVEESKCATESPKLCTSKTESVIVIEKHSSSSTNPHPIPHHSLTISLSDAESPFSPQVNN